MITINPHMVCPEGIDGDYDDIMVIIYSQWFGRRTNFMMTGRRFMIQEEGCGN
ncbi:hypothetical protein ACFLRF_06165 [Candidatus Altiarchaeota archaeon]